jgi:hypothetical protein
MLLPFTLLLSLTSLTLTSFITLNPFSHAKFKLRKEYTCNIHIKGDWDHMPPDTCIPTTDNGWNSIDVRQWPVCSNDTDAKLAFFGPLYNHYCDSSPDPSLDPRRGGGRFMKLESKDEVLNKCGRILGRVGSISFWCEGPPAVDLPPTWEEKRKGAVIKYPGENCDRANKLVLELYEPDTCIDINEGLGIE